LLPNYLFTNHKPQTSLLAAKMVVPKAGWPDWANFRLLGDCLQWAILLQIIEVAKIFGLLYSTVKVMN
jgi:hypothetical protein